MPNRIVIVGAGFCGTVLAANLLRCPPAEITEIVLIERRSAMGRGLAYAEHEFPYLLNVPAGRLSADSRYPLQFLSFAQRSLPDADAEEFLPRALYGDYLQDVLAQAERDAASRVRLVRITGEVTRLSQAADHAALTVCVADRDSLEATRVILALGNPPARLAPWAEQVRQHPAYLHDPWALPRHLRPQNSVLIVGNGLTMADVVYWFTRDATRAPRLMTLSRRGLIPLPQSEFRSSAVQGSAEFFAAATTIRAVVAASRALAQDVAQLGGDWREVITFIRHLVPGLWQRLADAERRRFVRHVQSYWDVHRHRLPVQLSTRLERLRRQGTLSIHAGRIEGMQPDGERISVTWRPRGSDVGQQMSVDAVVNATGPDYSLQRSRCPLVTSLREAGWLTQDELELGIRTGPHGACRTAAGVVSDRLYYLGPMLRAELWEATAVPELRNHAEALARHLADAG